MSEMNPSALIGMFFRASGLNDWTSAASISLARKTHGPAPVTATRIRLPTSATKTPTIA